MPHNLTNRPTTTAAPPHAPVHPALLEIARFRRSSGVRMNPGSMHALASMGWSKREDLSQTRTALGAACVHEMIYAIGGELTLESHWTGLVEAFDPATGHWTTRAPMPTPRGLLAVVKGSDDKIYALGGYSGPVYTGRVERYDPLTDTWTGRSSMLAATAFLAAVATPDGFIYALGGYHYDELTKTAWSLDAAQRFSIATGEWTLVPPMPTARYGLVAAVARRGNATRIYAIGGFDAFSGAALPVVEEYDPVANTWTSRAAMPMPLWHAAAVTTSKQKIFVIGGMSNCETLATVEVYDPETDTWSTRTPMQIDRICHAAAITGDDRIFVMGGHQKVGDDAFTLASTEATVGSAA